MNEASLRALEWDQVRRLLARRARRDVRRAAFATLRPAGLSLLEIRERLAETADMRALRSRGGALALDRPPEAGSLLEAVAAEGAALDGLEILALARFAEGAADLGRDALRRIADAEGGSLAKPQRWTRDAEAFSRGAELPFVASARKALAPNGEVRDDASPELRKIRARLLRLRDDLNVVFGAFLQRTDADRILQDKVVASRNGRSVLMVKAEARGAVPGVVHASSRGGQTAFVEPLEAVAVNNDIAVVSEEEQEEIRRILQAISREARASLAELEAIDRALEAWDDAHARAALADDLRATAPDYDSPDESGRSRLAIASGRHPLLIASIRSELELAALPRDVVPLVLEIPEDRPALVIGGPNTGGKTVALKTVGLLALMGLSGLPIPAAKGTTLPLVEKVFADIGDDQSMSEGLSTFSGQLRAIAQMTFERGESALVLLDELGSGTDPLEGGALGSAIVEDFARRGALVITTTHNADLKAFAAGSSFARVASFGYDEASFVPTYALVPDTAGRSLAIETAARLGVPSAVVERARGLLPESARRAEELIKELGASRDALEREREELSRKSADLEAERAELERRNARLADDERRIRSDLRASLEVERAKEDARLRRLFATAEEKLADTKTRASLARLRAETLSAIAPEAERVAAAAASPDPAFNEGDFVRSSDLGWEGRVLKVHGVDVDIEARGKKIRLPLAKLTKLSKQDARALARAVPKSRPSSTDRSAEREAPSAATEIVLIGQRVDEALPKVDKALDDSFLADEREIRIVHGFGSGTLKRAIRDLLKGHPHVASFRDGAPAEGGGGATVVVLRD